MSQTDLKQSIAQEGHPEVPLPAISLAGQRAQQTDLPGDLVCEKLVQDETRKNVHLTKIKFLSAELRFSAKPVGTKPSSESTVGTQLKVKRNEHVLFSFIRKDIKLDSHLL